MVLPLIEHKKTSVPSEFVMLARNQVLGPGQGLSILLYRLQSIPPVLSSVMLSQHGQISFQTCLPK